MVHNHLLNKLVQFKIQFFCLRIHITCYNGSWKTTLRKKLPNSGLPLIRSWKIPWLVFLIENIIPWLSTDFYKLLRFSLTFNKIPWLFPDLEKFFVFPWLFPDRGNPVAGNSWVRILKLPHPFDSLNISSKLDRDSECIVRNESWINGG